MLQTRRGYIQPTDRYLELAQRNTDLLNFHKPLTQSLYFPSSIHRPVAASLPPMARSIPPVALILGAGSNIGSHVARVFAEKGYKVASASRKQVEENSTADQLCIQSDFTDPASVANAFANVTRVFGPPSVVVYNGNGLPCFIVNA